MTGSIAAVGYWSGWSYVLPMPPVVLQTVEQQVEALLDAGNAPSDIGHHLVESFNRAKYERMNAGR